MEQNTRFKRAEFVKLQFNLRFAEFIIVDLSTLLRLRRSLRATAQYCFFGGQGGHTDRFSRLFEPELSSDPVAQRQFQKSGPAFVLNVDLDQLGTYQKGDTVTFDAIIWGGDLGVVHDFVRVIDALGKIGLRPDAGRFEMFEVYAEDSAMQLQQVWSRGDVINDLVAPVRDGEWWLNSCALGCDSVRIEFITPSRLIVKKRPMFDPTFKLIFPFILRRVTSMLYSHCCLDLSVDSQPLLDAAASIKSQRNLLRWNDWRELQRQDCNQPLGGVEGSVDLCGAGLIDLVPFLYLGSLMNLGKNASFGAGQYRVIPCGENEKSEVAN